jgi:hypothetical protein
VERYLLIAGTGCRLVNVFIVAPDSLPTLVDSSLKQARTEAMRYSQKTLTSASVTMVCLDSLGCFSKVYQGASCLFVRVLE